MKGLLLCALSLLARPTLAGPQNAGSVGIPHFATPSPAWIGWLNANGFAFASPAAYGPLAAAAQTSGLAPDDPSRAGPAARESLLASAAPQRAELAALVATLKIPERPGELGSVELASLYSELRYLDEAIAPNLPPDSIDLARRLYEPVRAAAFARKLIDQEGRLTRTAEALGLTRSNDGIDGKFSRPRSGLSPVAVRAAPRAEPIQSGPTIEKPAPSFRQRIARKARVAALTAIAAVLFRGGPPIVASDMDETLTGSQAVASPETIDAIAAILRAGGSYGLLSGASADAIETQVLGPLRRRLGTRESHLLARFAFASRSGAQVYKFDPALGGYGLFHTVDLERTLEVGGVNDGLARVQRILDETARRFDFEGEARRLIGKGIQGETIVLDHARRAGTTTLTQITMVPAGRKITATDKERYDRASGRARREEYARFINRRLKEEGVPLEARVAGKTSIDIGLDKGAGLEALARALDSRAARVLWAGDSHEPAGNDRLAALAAGAALHVGPPLSRRPRRLMISDSGGPEAMRAYLQALARYARLVARR